MTIDGHMHYALPIDYKLVLKALDLTGSDKGTLLSQINTIRSTENIDILYAKYNSNGRIFAFGALDPTLYYQKEAMSYKMVEHVKNLMACGFDGIKMLDGKPSERKNFPIPNFDEQCWEPYFSYMEENRIPIVWHVNDPEEFWDKERCPDWAVRSGWFYGDGNWINNEDQYRQIINVLKKHPNLVITFAHFFFLSAQLERLAAIFDMCPNVGVDTTPGIELFTNMSGNIEKARAFFIKYQDRIRYGTDIILNPEETDFDFCWTDYDIRQKLCHEFITRDHVHVLGDERGLFGKEDLDINGLALSESINNKYLSGNFISKVSEKPKELNISEIIKEISRERKRVTFLAGINGEEPNFEIIDFCENFFKNIK